MLGYIKRCIFMIMVIKWTAWGKRSNYSGDESVCHDPSEIRIPVWSLKSSCEDAYGGCLQHVPSAQVGVTAQSFHSWNFWFQIAVFQNLRVSGYKLMSHWIIFSALLIRAWLCLYWHENNEISVGFVFQGKGSIKQNCSLKESCRGFGALRRGKKAGPASILTLSSAQCSQTLPHLAFAAIKLEWFQYIFHHLVHLEGSLTQSTEYSTMSNSVNGTWRSQTVEMRGRKTFH